MKMRQLITPVVALLLTAGNVYAGPGKPHSHPIIGNNGHHYAYGHKKMYFKKSQDIAYRGTPYTVPEIDAASGTSAIALLTGILLLVGEKVRSKRK